MHPLSVINRQVSDQVDHEQAQYIIFYHPMATPPLQQLVEMAKQMDTVGDLPIVGIQDVLSVFDETLENSPNQIKELIEKLIQLQQEMTAHSQEYQKLQLAHFYDFMVGVFDKFKVRLKKNNRMELMLKLAVELLETTEPADGQVDISWAEPAEGFSEDDSSEPYSELKRAILGSIDRLFTIAGPAQSLEKFSQLFSQKMTNQQDWRSVYAALMAASQISQGEQEPQQLLLFAQNAQQSLTHPHPKIRYASLQLIGQYCEDIKPDFAEKVFDSLMPAIIKSLDDNVARVSSHALACLTNLFEDFPDTAKIEACLGQLLPKVLMHLQSGKTLKQENAVATLASLGTNEGCMGPNLATVVEAVSQTAQYSKGKPTHTQLLSQCFETMSMILAQQPKDQVIQYVNSFVDQLYQCRQSITNSYFLGAWNRLCRQFENFASVNQFLPYILEITQTMVIDASDDDVETALQAIDATFTCFGAAAAPYAQQVYNLAFEIVDKQYAQGSKTSAYNLVPTVLKTLPAGGTQPVTALETLFESLQKKFDGLSNDGSEMEDVSIILSTIKDVFEIHANSGVTWQTVKTFANKIESTENQVTTVYNNLYKSKQDQGMELEEQDQQIIKEALEELALIMEQIPELYSLIFKFCPPENKQQLVSGLLQKVPAKLELDDEAALLGLNTVLSVVENCQLPELTSLIAEIMGLFMRFSNHRNSQVRNSAIYGIGLLVSMTPPTSVTPEDLQKCLQCLWTAKNQPCTAATTKRLLGHLSDNIVSTLGKILDNLGSTYPQILNQQIYNQWLAQLPLNTDVTQGDSMQLLLIKILDNKPDLVVTNPDSLLTICKIYAKYVVKRRKSKEKKHAIKETKQSLIRLKQWPVFNNAAEYLWSCLTANQIKVLNNLINQ